MVGISDVGSAKAAVSLWEPVPDAPRKTWTRETEGCELFCSLALRHTAPVYDMYIHHCALVSLTPELSLDTIRKRMNSAWIAARLLCPNIALKTAQDCKSFFHTPLLDEDDAVEWAQETTHYASLEKLTPESVLEERANLFNHDIYSKNGFANSLWVYTLGSDSATTHTSLALILRIDHAQFDATGVEIFLGHLLRLFAQGAKEVAFDGSEQRNLPPATNHLIREDLRPSPEDHAIVLEKSLGGLDGPILGYKHSLPLPPKAWGVTRHVNIRLDETISKKLLRVAKEHGRTISQLQYTALMLSELAHDHARTIDKSQTSATRMSVNLRPLIKDEWGGGSANGVTMPAITPHSIVVSVGEVLERYHLRESPAKIIGNQDVFWSFAELVGQQFRQAASLSGPLAFIQDQVVDLLMKAETPPSNASFIMICDGISDRYTPPIIKTSEVRLDVPWKTLSINYGGEDDTPLVNARCWSWRGEQYFGFDYNESALSQAEANEIMTLWQTILLKGTGIE